MCICISYPQRFNTSFQIVKLHRKGDSIYQDTNSLYNEEMKLGYLILESDFSRETYSMTP